jgi:hypothetical protein
LYDACLACLREAESPHRWNETWSELFTTDIPVNFNERLVYLEKTLKELPGGKKLPPKYGTGKPYQEIKGTSDFRRRKKFVAAGDEDIV